MKPEIEPLHAIAANLIPRRAAGPRQRLPLGQPVTPQDLQLLSRLEGRRPLKLRELAELLEVSVTRAWHIMADLKARGLVTIVAATPSRAGAVEVRAYVTAALDVAGWRNALEVFLRNDDTVIEAFAVTGEFDYLVRGLHPSEAAARCWFHGLLSHAAVARAEFHGCRTIFERPLYAAALLGTPRGAQP